MMREFPVSTCVDFRTVSSGDSRGGSMSLAGWPLCSDPPRLRSPGNDPDPTIPHDPALCNAWNGYTVDRMGRDTRCPGWPHDVAPEDVKTIYDTPLVSFTVGTDEEDH
jgi:hypothetical protein